MKYEDDGNLPFLDILVSKKFDGPFSGWVIHKKMYIEHYFHALSHNYHSEKVVVLKTLATRALWVANEDNLKDEKTHPLNVFEMNGYSIS